MQIFSFILIHCTVIAIDQISKFFARHSIETTSYQEGRWAIHLNYIENSMGFLGIYDQSSTLLRFFALYLLPMALILLGNGYLFYRKKISRYHFMLGTTLLAAALSNLLDRFFHKGAVIDFLQVVTPYGASGIANIADLIVIITAFLLGYSLLQPHHNNEHNIQKKEN